MTWGNVLEEYLLCSLQLGQFASTIDFDPCAKDLYFVSVHRFMSC